MLKIETANRIYWVRFRHDLDMKVTQCRIEATNGLAIGEAFCHPCDQYDKAIGRKIALRRALIGFSRPFRANVWQEYWKKIGKVG